MSERKAEKDMYKVEEIAKWFVRRAQYDYDFGYSDEMLSNLKLQKLLYYAQGCVFAITGVPLFEEEIQAWANGPAVPIVYHQYEKCVESEKSYTEGFSRVTFDETDNGKTISDILESVYTEFGQFSDWRLREIVQNEKPWKETAKNQAISTELIRSYFLENYTET